MEVVIAGGGIAGLTAGICLADRGHEVVLLERAPELRTEGYMIDFFGSGYDVAERLGLLDRLAEIHYPVPELAFLTPDGEPRVSISYARFRAMFDGRHFNFMRGDLERVLYEALPPEVDVRFGASVEGVEERSDGVRVVHAGGSETCDLLVGADGIHSHVRETVFGPEQRFLRYLGFHTAAYVVEDPRLSETVADAFHTLTVPGRQAALYPIRGGKTATFFVHRAADAPGDDASCATLREVYGGMGWVVPELLERCNETLYYDGVSQIVMPRWSEGRVVLVGDACQAPSLLAGQGASMAMGGAWVLADELSRRPTIGEALTAYENRIRPAIEDKQRAGRRMADWFVPASRTRIALRDAMLRVGTLPGLTWLMKRVVSSDSVLR